MHGAEVKKGRIDGNKKDERRGGEEKRELGKESRRKRYERIQERK